MIVLDTCAIIWDALQQDKLTKRALKAINKADHENCLIVSDISFWEIAMLVKKGRLKLDTTTTSFIALYLQFRNITVAAISPEIAEVSVGFSDGINQDPADRIIVATSLVHRACLVTADSNLLAVPTIETCW
jgi:PIN domain nuclease of toxin-antitoxin system